MRTLAVPALLGRSRMVVGLKGDSQQGPDRAHFELDVAPLAPLPPALPALQRAAWPRSAPTRALLPPCPLCKLTALQQQLSLTTLSIVKTGAIR